MVVGAGVTGVLAAIYLARRGYNVQVRKQRLSAYFRVCCFYLDPNARLGCNNVQVHEQRASGGGGSSSCRALAG